MSLSKAQIEFLAPSGNPIQPQLLWALGEQTSGWQTSVSISLFKINEKDNKTKVDVESHNLFTLQLSLILFAICTWTTYKSFLTKKNLERTNFDLETTSSSVLQGIILETFTEPATVRRDGNNCNRWEFFSGKLFDYMPGEVQRVHSSSIHSGWCYSGHHILYLSMDKVFPSTYLEGNILHTHFYFMFVSVAQR